MDTMVSKVKWLFLDLDNTLLDFDASSKVALQQTFSSFGIADIPEAFEIYHRINSACWKSFELGDIDVATLKKRRFDLFVEAAQVKERGDVVNQYYLSLLAKQQHEVEGASAFLQWAAARFHLAVATNGFAQVQHPRIDGSGFRRHFQHVFISEELGFQKPNQAFFDIAFQRIGRPPKEEVMMIGDSLQSDIAGAMEYGLLSCWFDRHQQGGSHLPVADFTIRHLSELPQILTPAVNQEVT